MRAAWYERTGSPHEVLTVGEIDAPTGLLRGCADAALGETVSR